MAVCKYELVTIQLQWDWHESVNAQVLKFIKRLHVGVKIM